MNSTLQRKKAIYCETFIPAHAKQQQNIVVFLQMLFEHGIIQPDQFFLYKNTENEIQIVGDPFAQITVDLEAALLRIDGTQQIRQEIADSNPFKLVEHLLKSIPIVSLRAYGYVTFDLVRYFFEYGKTKIFETPLLCFVVPKVEVRISAQGVHIRSVNAQTIQSIADLWEDSLQHESVPPSDTTTLTPAMEDRMWYEQAVHTLVEDIRANAAHCGPFQKAILSRFIEVPGPLDLLRTYARIQEEPSARSYCFRWGNDAAVGLSPETLLEADTCGGISTHPLAGTRWRGKTAQEDAWLHTQLQTSHKQQIEHLISVVAVQREMETVCQRGTVCIHDLAHVQQYRAVQHLATRLSGQLASEKTAWDALRAVFPGVTVSGVSKEAAISWIDRLEQRARGLYAGAVGWVDSNGSADLAITLRTIVQRSSRVSFCVGAGIVADSDPADEYEETWHKLRTIWPYFVRLAQPE